MRQWLRQRALKIDIVNFALTMDIHFRLQYIDQPGIFKTIRLYGYVFYTISINIPTFFYKFDRFSTPVVAFYHSCHFSRLGKRNLWSILVKRRSLNDTWIMNFRR